MGILTGLSSRRYPTNFTHFVTKRPQLLVNCQTTDLVTPLALGPCEGAKIPGLFFPYAGLLRLGQEIG